MSVSVCIAVQSTPTRLGNDLIETRVQGSLDLRRSSLPSATQYPVWFSTAPLLLFQTKLSGAFHSRKDGHVAVEYDAVEPSARFLIGVNGVLRG